MTDLWTYLDSHRPLQEDLEEWMKILACASFDYMKLMVVELQHQLAELEEAERAAAVAADHETDGGEPKPPPRQRANPFSNQVPFTLTDVKKTHLKTIWG